MTKLHAPNANPDHNPDDHAWCLIAEFSFPDLSSEHDPRDGLAAELLARLEREPAMPPGFAENIARAFTGVTKDSFAQIKQGELGTGSSVRVFCQKKILDELHTARAGLPPFDIDQTIHPEQMVLEPDPKMCGGWGYYVIERGIVSARAPRTETGHVIEMYIYQEGG